MGADGEGGTVELGCVRMAHEVIGGEGGTMKRRGREELKILGERIK